LTSGQNRSQGLPIDLTDMSREQAPPRVDRSDASAPV
jgi:hypothetical protein